MWLCGYCGARARKSPGDGEYVKPYVCSYLVACRMSLTQHVVVSVATRVDIVQIVSLQPARARSTVGVLYVYHTRPHEKRALLASAVVVARRTHKQTDCTSHAPWPRAPSNAQPTSGRNPFCTHWAFAWLSESGARGASASGPNLADAGSSPQQARASARVGGRLLVDRFFRVRLRPSVAAGEP